MVKYRGFVVANKGPGGRRAMRDSGKKTYPTKKGAIRDMRGDNDRWMKKNYSSDFVKKSNFEYGAVPDGMFPDGIEGNKKLLAWHDAQNTKKNTTGRNGLWQICGKPKCNCKKSLFKTPY